MKGTDVLGYLASMRDHFDGKKTTWWNTYYKLENVTQNITKWNCTEKVEPFLACLGQKCFGTTGFVRVSRGAGVL